MLARSLRSAVRRAAARMHAPAARRSAAVAARRTVSFAHIYFSPDRGGAESARVRALRALAQLSIERAERVDCGDPFPGRYEYVGLDAAELRRTFGLSELSELVFDAPAGTWSGPYRSAFGWHLVYVFPDSR